MFCCIMVCASCTLKFVSFRVFTVAPRSLIWLPNVPTLDDSSSKRFGKLAISGAAWKYSCTLCKSCWICASCKSIDPEGCESSRSVSQPNCRYYLCGFTCTVKLFICCLRSDNLEKIIVWLFWRSLDKEWHFCKASGTPSLPAITVMYKIRYKSVKKIKIARYYNDSKFRKVLIKNIYRNRFFSYIKYLDIKRVISYN